jgi:uncharacterized DUF497 family protein
MVFEWDERRRTANLTKHGIDFERAKLIFDGPTLEGPDDRQKYGEQRIGAYGVAEGEVLFIVYTWRGSSRRLISARKAGTDERETYSARVAAGGADDE